MTKGRPKKDRTSSVNKRIRKLRSMWRQTEEGRKKCNAQFRGSVEDELDKYFNATLFNASLHLDELERYDKPSRKFTMNAKKLRAELKLAGELGEFFIRKAKGFI